MATKTSSDELQAIGKAYYANRDFPAALDAFSAALDARDADQVDLLDNRSATFEKLGDLQLALRDARAMIKFDRKNPKGYLRSGRVLQKMDKLDIAYGIYSYGLRQVSLKDPNYEDIKALHGQLLLQVSPPRSIDPFTMLPVELVVAIMNHLSFKKMVNCLRVSKHWYKFLVSFNAFWTSLDLTDAKRPVPASFVRACVSRSHYNIQSAVLRSLNNKGESLLKPLTQNCKNLLALEVHQGFEPATLLADLPRAVRLRRLKLGPKCAITLDALQGLLSKCPSLREVEFHDIHARTSVIEWPDTVASLTSCVLVGDGISPSSTAKTLDSFLVKARHLKSLSLHGWQFTPRAAGHVFDFSHLAGLDSLSLADFHARDWPKLPPSIKHLYLDMRNLDCRVRTSMSTTLQETYIPALVDLTLKCPLQPEQVQLLLQPSNQVQTVDRTLPRLRSLATRWSLQDSPSTIIKTLSIGELAAVQELDLTGSGVDDAVLAKIPDTLSSLQRLDLAHTMVTGAGVKALVQGLRGQLVWLGLNWCDEVSSDAVSWARSQGVQVHHQKNGPMQIAKSGRRVRYQ